MTKATEKVTVRTYLFEQAVGLVGVTEEKWLEKVMKFVNARATGRDQNEEKARADWAKELAPIEQESTKA
jgi:hypothetical protein